MSEKQGWWPKWFPYPIAWIRTIYLLFVIACSAYLLKIFGFWAILLGIATSAVAPDITLFVLICLFVVFLIPSLLLAFPNHWCLLVFHRESFPDRPKIPLWIPRWRSWRQAINGWLISSICILACFFVLLPEMAFSDAFYVAYGPQYLASQQRFANIIAVVWIATSTLLYHWDYLVYTEVIARPKWFPHPLTWLKAAFVFSPVTLLIFSWPNRGTSGLFAGTDRLWMVPGEVLALVLVFACTIALLRQTIALIFYRQSLTPTQPWKLWIPQRRFWERTALIMWTWIVSSIVSLALVPWVFKDYIDEVHSRLFDVYFLGNAIAWVVAAYIYHFNRLYRRSQKFRGASTSIQRWVIYPRSWLKTCFLYAMLLLSAKATAALWNLAYQIPPLPKPMAFVAWEILFISSVTSPIWTIAIVHHLYRLIFERRQLRSIPIARRWFPPARSWREGWRGWRNAIVASLPVTLTLYISYGREPLPEEFTITYLLAAIYWTFAVAYLYQFDWLRDRPRCPLPKPKAATRPLDPIAIELNQLRGQLGFTQIKPPRREP